MSSLIAIFTWWLVVQLLGLAVLPLAQAWLRWLPDRGYFFAKPLGILLVSYALWLGATFGLIDNDRLAIALIAIVIAGFAWARRAKEAVRFLRQHLALVLTVEVIFAAAFVVWAIVRAYNPDIVATEKPMEIAFLNGVLRSSQFPPVDPWLSGYSISYYYFGYVAVAMLAKLAAVPAAIAFNLAIGMLFGLTVAGVFSLGYNLVARRESGRFSGGGVACGLLSATLVVLAANLESIVELLDAHGLISTGVWRWLSIKDLPPPYQSPSLLPTDYWWWFRATRVIGDFDPVTQVSRDYTINEFPFFSFMLGDLHPHLLALPFAVLALAVSLNLLFDPAEWSADMLWRRRFELFMVGLVFGGLGFMNSWDMPAYLLVFGAVFAVRRYLRTSSLDGALLGAVLRFGGVAVLASIVLYLPFYLGFRSQATGLGLVVVRSKLQHFAIFWGPLFFLALSWLVVHLRNASRPPRAGLPSVDKWAGAQYVTPARGQRRLLLILSAVVLVALIVVHAEVAALLLVLLAVSAATFRRRLERDPEAGPKHFVWLLLLAGFFLLFICEWVYIRDFFNNRMNTVFKLYFQSWLLLALAGGYVLYFFAVADRQQAARSRQPDRLPGAALGLGKSRYVWWPIAGLLLAASLVYPVAATWSKTDGFAGPPTLDGQSFMQRVQPADDEAIRWLQANVPGTPVILEATGSSYGPAGRVSAFTGLPTLLGWDFHEHQWRGSADEQDKRKADINTIFSSVDRATAQILMRQYGVSYVYVGPLERDAYAKYGPAVLGKFASFMDVAHRNEGVTIYRMRD